MSFLLSPYGRVLAGLVGIALLIVAAWFDGHSYGQKAAQADILKQINQENEHAGNEAERWRSDYRRCVDAGGLYDFEAGSCDK